MVAGLAGQMVLRIARTTVLMMSGNSVPSINAVAKTDMALKGCTASSMRRWWGSDEIRSRASVAGMHVQRLASETLCITG